MTRTISLILCAALGLAAQVACKRPSLPPVAAVPDGTPVAWVGEEVIYVEDLLEPRLYGDPQARRAAVDVAVSDRLATQEARRRGLDRNTAVLQEITRIRRDAAERERGVLRRALALDIGRQLLFTDSDIKAKFDEAPARYADHRVTLRRARYDSRTAALTADRKLGPSGRLGKDSSEQIGPVVSSEIPREWAVDLRRFRNPGDRRIIEADGAVWLVELAESGEHQPESFQEVRPRIQRDLRLEKARQEFARTVSELRSDAKIRIDEGVLSRDKAWSGLDANH